MVPTLRFDDPRPHGRRPAARRIAAKPPRVIPATRHHVGIVGGEVDQAEHAAIIMQGSPLAGPKGAWVRRREW